MEAQPGAPTYQGLEKLAYADAVIRETLRLMPNGAVALREATRDMLLGGRWFGQSVAAGFSLQQGAAGKPAIVLAPVFQPVDLGWAALQLRLLWAPPGRWHCTLGG